MNIEDKSQHLLAVQGLLEHPFLALIANTIHYVLTEEVEVALRNYRQQQEALAATAATTNPRGHLTDDTANFI